MTRSDLNTRIDSFAWPSVECDLEARGHAVLPALLSADECSALAGLYPDASRFRSRIIMARHNFGRGEYQYFDDPLPDLVSQLRAASYPRLVPIANAWSARMKLERRWPDALDALRAECRAVGQVKPTSLLLKYGPGDYNCLHRDLYGELVFPLQLAVLLSEPKRDFEGGEFVLTEQRPRMQSRVDVVPLRRGDAVLFAAQRPVRGVRGDHRVQMRHGVSRIVSGERYTLGVIFHDAT